MSTVEEFSGGLMAKILSEDNKYVKSPFLKVSGNIIETLRSGDTGMTSAVTSDVIVIGLTQGIIELLLAYTDVDKQHINIDTNILFILSPH
jgi:hypothetical protein